MLEKSPFLLRIDEVRARARRAIEDGAVTPSYGADREAVLRILNEALATEMICVLRYRRFHFMATGIRGLVMAQEFLDHANEELTHADAVARRIVQLGGEPDFDPSSFAQRSHSEYAEGTDLNEMIQTSLVAERIVIQSYTEMVRDIGDGDPTTRRLLEDILATEEEHAQKLGDLLEGLGR